MSAFPDIKIGGNSQIGKKRCRPDRALLAKFGDFVVSRRHVAEMSATCAAKIEDGQSTKHDLTWLIHGMRSGSLTWVTDGSYDRKRAPVSSGVGWIIFCTNTGKALLDHSGSDPCLPALIEPNC